MSRKVFISFLGTTGYKECVYVLNGNKSSVVSYVQEAIIQLVCDSFSNSDIALFCLTKAAYEKHYETLNQRVLNYKNISPLYIENIPEGFTESEVWDIFQVIYEQLNEGDELYLDITHGFRSLPMLGIVLLNYAKMLKKTTIGGIYYGAFEKLGSSYQIEEKYPNPSDRECPILNLKAFAELQDWTNAASIFFELGSTKKLIQVADENKFLPFQLSKKEQNRLNEKFKNLASALSNYSLDIYTNRGDKIIENNNVEKLIDNINEISGEIKDFSDLKPLYYILDLIKLQLIDYKPNSLWNGFHAIQYCIESQLYQQGITLLQEFTISFIIKDLGLENSSNERIKVLRTTIENILKSDENITSKVEQKKDIKLLSDSEIKDLKTSISNNELCNSIAQEYKSFSFEYRNDINHAGFGRKGKKSSEFEKALIKNYNSLKNIISSYHKS